CVARAPSQPAPSQPCRRCPVVARLDSCRYPSGTDRRRHADGSRRNRLTAARRIAQPHTPTGDRLMLIRLLRTYLRRYKRQLIIVLVLQAAQTIAALYLPSLNADIIDKGVARGDTGYIWSTGRIMLV